MRTEILRISIIVVSDSVFDGKNIDKSGNELKSLIEQYHEKLQPFILSPISYVPDNENEIQNEILKYSDYNNQLGVIFTVGGTGFSSRDVTPDVTRKLITRDASCLSNYILLKNSASVPYAALSRGISGIRNKMLIINFPGSQKAVKECFSCLIDLIPHAINLMSENFRHESIEYPENNSSVGKNACNCSIDNQEKNSGSLIDYEDALNLLLNRIVPLKKTTKFPIEQCLNLKSNEEIVSNINIPEKQTSFMDGYACYGQQKAGTILKIEKVQFFSANLRNFCEIISTGNFLPVFYNTVIPLENAVNENGHIKLLCDVEENQYLREIGSDLKRGETILNKEDFLTINHIVLLKSLGYETIECFDKLNIGILSTGDEIVKIGTKKNPHQVFDINSEILKNEITKKDLGNVFEFGIVRDRLEDITHKISEMEKTCDVIISSGGSSVGEKDFIEKSLKSIGFTIIFNKLNIKPGKPTIFAVKRIEEKNVYFFGLPGNPVSCWVTYHLFVKVLICEHLGKNHSIKIKVKIFEDIEISDSRMEFIRARFVKGVNDEYPNVSRIVKNQQSSKFLSTLGCDILVIIPSESKTNLYPKGTILDGILI